MMIVPQFRINQDDECVFVIIRAPMAKLQETQVEYDGESFLFWSKPYHLRLKLPKSLDPNEEAKVSWNASSNEFTVKLFKLNTGEFFDGLDMITQLLTVKDSSHKTMSPLIEVMSSEMGKDDKTKEVEDEKEFNWLVEQDEWTKEKDIQLLGEKYGFANMYSGTLARFKEEIDCLIDLKDAERKTSAQRRDERLEMDMKKFDDEYYWSDLYDQKEKIDDLINYVTKWETKQSDYIFTDDEVFKLKNLPKREYLLTRRDKFLLLLGLVDILFAYSYEMRINEEECTCESGWTITKLSSSLSWLEQFTDLNQVMHNSVQRSLIYPLYRNWNLSLKVMKDVQNILNNGKICILKCFLDIHKIFNESGDLRYLLNELYITDYCVWLQNVKEKTFLSLADCMSKVNLCKKDLDIPIKLAEMAAEMALAETENTNCESQSDLNRSE